MKQKKTAANEKYLCIFFECMFIISLTIYSTFCSAQLDTKKWVQVGYTGWKTDNLAYTFAKTRTFTVSGQQFTVVFENKSSDVLNVKGNLYAATTCGTEIYAGIDISVDIKPGEKIGGEDYLFEQRGGITGVVHKEDCQGADVIASITIKDFVVTNVTQQQRELQKKEEKRQVDEKEKKEKEDQAEKQKQEKERKDAEDRKAEEARKQGNDSNQNNSPAESRTTNQPGYLTNEQQDRQNKFAAKESMAASQTVRDMQMSEATAGMMGAMLTAGGGEHSGKHFFGMGFQFGVGYRQMPIIANASNDTSVVQTTAHPALAFGLKLDFFDNRGISIHLNPFCLIGYDIFTDGVDGLHSSYGALLQFELSRKCYSTFKLYTELGFDKREGDWSYNALFDNVTKDASYDYSLFRYGGGVKINITKPDGDEKNNECYLMLGYHYENISFLAGDIQPKPGFSMERLALPLHQPNLTLTQMMDLKFFKGGWIISASFSKNYPVAGQLLHPIEAKNQDYFLFMLMRQLS